MVDSKKIVCCFFTVKMKKMKRFCLIRRNVNDFRSLTTYILCNEKIEYIIPMKSKLYPVIFKQKHRKLTMYVLYISLSIGSGTGHYLYPGLWQKRNYFERKKFIYQTINNRKFSNTPPFISLKNNYPTFANTFVI